MPRRTSRRATGRRAQRRRQPRRQNYAALRKKAYAPARKKSFLRKSNPIAENKKVEATEISTDVGRNALGNPILTDFSAEPTYLNNEPPLNGGEDLAVANLPTGARGYPLRDAVFNFNPDSCLYQTQGLDNNSMIGSSCYQKLCSAKFLFRWPQPSMNTGLWNGRTTDMPDNDAPLADKTAWLKDPLNNHMGVIPNTPQSYHLYWGFIKTPTGYSDFTTPDKENASAVELERHINLRVEEWFNQRIDRIQFIPKVGNDMKIIGKKKISPPWDRRTGVLPTSHVQITDIDGDDVSSSVVGGTIPDTLVKITWPLNKKVHWQKTNNFSGDGYPANADQAPVFYQNHSWLPFAAIVNWNAASLPKSAAGHVPGDAFTLAEVQREQRVPHVVINDITYYRDS